MYTYREQLVIIWGIRVPDGTTIRTDCPFCGGRNTFTISRRGREQVWNCYRAGCASGGSMGSSDDSVNGVKRRLEARTEASSKSPIPPLTNVETQPTALVWLQEKHSLLAHARGLLTIKYAPGEDRIMFPVGSSLNQSVPTGYTGFGTKPKWRKYGDCTKLFACGYGDIAVLVEDAPSACAVGVLSEYTGVSLLGTVMTREHLMGLRQFKRVIVCLDPDAQRKGLAMASVINGTVPAVMHVIPNDLKYYEPDEIKSILTENDDGRS